MVPVLLATLATWCFYLHRRSHELELRHRRFAWDVIRFMHVSAGRKLADVDRELELKVGPRP